MIRKLKRELKSILDEIGHPVGFQIVPDNNIFPHIVIDIPTDAYQEGMHNLALDVDVWDRAESTQKVDEIAEAIISKLNRTSLNIPSSHTMIHLVSMGTVESNDPTLRRKTLIFSLQTRSKENGTM